MAWPTAGFTAPVVLGKDAKVRWGGQGVATTFSLGVRTGTITCRAADHEVGDTEDAIVGGLSSAAGVGNQVPTQGTIVGYEAHQGGRQVAEVALMWYSKFDLIPTVGVIAQGGMMSNVYILPKGMYTGQVPQGAWIFPYLQILDSTPMRLDINQPQEGSFTAKSTGPFTMPTA